MSTQIVHSGKSWFVILVSSKLTEEYESVKVSKPQPHDLCISLDSLPGVSVWKLPLLCDIKVDHFPH